MFKEIIQAIAFFGEVFILLVVITIAITVLKELIKKQLQ